MAKSLAVANNRDIVVSWIYVWSKQQEMSINEQRIILRILEFCQSELDGVRIKNNLRKIQHGLQDVNLKMFISDVFFSNYKPADIKQTLLKLRERSFVYEDTTSDKWWACGFIEKPEINSRDGVMSFFVDNRLWDVFMNLTKGYRKFELNKALALPTSYSIRFYMFMSGQTRPLNISIDNLKERLGIPANMYKNRNGRDRIDHLEERVLKPAKAALDRCCPYTFSYIKVRENPRNGHSKVIGFRFYPRYQPQFRDDKLEMKCLKSKVTAYYQMSSRLYEYLYYSCGFTSQEINRNKKTFTMAEEKIKDLIGELSALNEKSKNKKNPKGWIVNSIKGMMKDRCCD